MVVGTSGQHQGDRYKHDGRRNENQEIATVVRQREHRTMGTTSDSRIHASDEGYVVATRNSSPLVGGRSPSVRSAKYR